MDENNDQSEMGRRSFLAISVISIAGLISLGIVVPSIVYIVGPALQSSQRGRVGEIGVKVKGGNRGTYTVQSEDSSPDRLDTE